METYRRNKTVGIYQAEQVARIYKDKIIVTEPCIKWIGSNGNLSERKHRIKGDDVREVMAAELGSQNFWDLIEYHIGNAPHPSVFE